MLTLKPLGSSSSASHYYTDQDSNYYLSDKSAIEQSSSWEGKGAKKLGLEGKVDAKQFLELLDGRLPNGEVLGIVKEKGKREHRAGTDITLSAPKSFSIMALAGKDKRLLDVQKKAAEATMECIENLAAEARITINGKALYEKTGNLIFAAFKHMTSRELDPDVHTHLVTLNATERSDGKWRALSSKNKNDKGNLYNGFREIIYDNQHYLGLVYMSALAKGTVDVGYDIEIKDKYGNFEIKEVSKKLIDSLSKRRKDIKAKQKEKGVNSAKSAEVANKDTRHPKKSIDLASLHKRWDAEIKEHNVDLQKIIDTSKENKKGIIKPNLTSSISPNVTDAVTNAFSHLSQYRSSVRHSDLVRQSFMFAAGTIDHEQIEHEIETRLNNKKIIGELSVSYTNANLLKMEKIFVKKLLAGKGSSFSIESNKSDIVSTILKQKDRVQIVDMRSLSLEKSIIQDFIDQNESLGVNTYVLHQGRLQANQLKEQVGRGSSGFLSWFKNLFKDELVHTVSGFTHYYTEKALGFRGSKRNDAILVHDAQKLSYQEIERLDALAEKTNSKLVLFNNTKSTDGFHHGSPIKALKNAKIPSHDTQFKDDNAACDLRLAKEPLLDAVNSWCKLSSDERNMTVVIATSKKDQDVLNSDIRTSLKQMNVISHQEQTIIARSSDTLSEAQKKHTKFYSIGDVVATNAFTKEQRELTITSIGKEGLEVIDDKGKVQLINLREDTNFHVFKSKSIDVSLGDKLTNEQAIFTKQTKYEKGAQFKVLELNKKGLKLEVDNKRMFLTNDELKNTCLSHNYALRPSQLSRKYDEAIITAKPYRISQELVNDITRNAAKVTWLSSDIKQSIKTLNKEKVSWTIIEEVAGAKENVLRDARYANKVISKDINFLVKALVDDNQTFNQAEIADQAVSYAVAKCAERDAAFLHKDLMVNALMHALGKTTYEEISSIIEKRMAEGGLIHLDTHWITKETLALERQILSSNVDGRKSVNPILADKNRLLSMDSRFTQGQKDAISLTVTSRDRFNTVQGLAGVGKTTMMKEVQKICNENNINVEGLTPTLKAKQVLAANGIHSETVAKYLIDNKEYKTNTLFIVDEVSMVGNDDYSRLQKKCVELGARIVFTGDRSQLQSIPAGVAHELSITSFTQKTAYMEEIVRQNSNPILKEAAYLASEGKIKESYEKIASISPDDHISRIDSSDIKQDSSIIEMKVELDDETGEADYAPIYDAVSEDYLTRIPEHRERTLVIAHTNKIREQIDNRIRKGLQDDGSISLDDKLLIRYTSKDMQEADIIYSKNFAIGDVLRFDKGYSVAKRGDYFKVIEVNNEENKLICLDDENHKYTINPAKIAKGAAMTVYEEGNYNLSCGDRIRIKKSDNQRNISANSEYIVNHIEKGKLSLQSKTEKLTIDLNKHKDRHWDYAYTNTAPTIQGDADKFIIALELNINKQATTHRSHLINVTRAMIQVTFYTEDREKVVERMSNEKNKDLATKKSAHLMHEAHTIKKNIEQAIRAKKQMKSIISTKEPQHNTINQTQTLRPTIKEKQLTPSEIEGALKNDMAELCATLLGEENHKLSSKNNLRFGSKGSLNVNLSKGIWKDFETNEGGNCFELIKCQLGYSDFKDVIKYAKDFIGHTPDIICPQKININDEKISHKKQKGMREYAQKLVNRSTEVKGSLAEKYLTEIRNIKHFANADIRFIDEISTYHGDNKTTSSALIAFSRDGKGEVNHAQVTRLNPKTGDKDSASNCIKQTYGSVNGCYVELNKNHKRVRFLQPPIM